MKVFGLIAISFCFAFMMNIRSGVRAGVNVNMMMPLNTVDNNGNLVNPGELRGHLQKMKDTGVHGIMIDVWWGIAERNGPMDYDFHGYVELAALVQEVGLKMQLVASFHRCGGNVGDDCNIPIPAWVRSVGDGNPDIFYTDASGHRDTECLSLFADNESLFDGRTPIQMYENFMAAMADALSGFKDVIEEVQIGSGPAGELRYPSYQLDRWSYPGIGEFQCYDSYARSSLAAAAASAGHSEWDSPPSDAGGYNARPYDTLFFKPGGGYNSDYGKFFLGWYSGELIKHGERMLDAGQRAFGGTGWHAALKVAGIHWWFYSESHAAELTAGYYNTRERDGYAPIAQMLASKNAIFDFTCFEMTDASQAGCQCESGPEALVNQVLVNTIKTGVTAVAGENALPCDGDRGKYQQITYQARRYGDIEAMTYLRLNQNLLNTWDSFAEWVNNMNSK